MHKSAGTGSSPVNLFASLFLPFLLDGLFELLLRAQPRSCSALGAVCRPGAGYGAAHPVQLQGWDDRRPSPMHRSPGAQERLEAHHQQSIYVRKLAFVGFMIDFIFFFFLFVFEERLYLAL